MLGFTLCQYIWSPEPVNRFPRHVDLAECIHNVVWSIEPCFTPLYRGADKSLARPTSRCIFFDGGNISFDASLVIYLYI